MEKIDARKLGYEGRDTLRKMVLRLRKQSGLSGVELAKVAGVHVRTVQAWLRKVQTAGEGSLTERLRGRPPGACRKLSMVQEVWIRQRIVWGGARAMSFAVCVVTRARHSALVAAQSASRSRSPDREVPQALGLTAQRPASERWNSALQYSNLLREKYPAIAARAKAEGGVLYWADETAVKEDAHWVRGFAPAGRTPVLDMPARWDKLSMISAITNRGEISFQIVEGTINTERFIEFLERLLQEAPAKIFLIVDNLRVHHAKLVQQWIEPRLDKIELFYLPPYAPNPIRRISESDFKTSCVSNRPPLGKGSLQKAMRIMNRIAQWPERTVPISSTLMPHTRLSEAI